MIGKYRPEENILINFYENKINQNQKMPQGTYNSLRFSPFECCDFMVHNLKKIQVVNSGYIIPLSTFLSIYLSYLSVYVSICFQVREKILYAHSANKPLHHSCRASGLAPWTANTEPPCHSFTEACMTQSLCSTTEKPPQ